MRWRRVWALGSLLLAASCATGPMAGPPEPVTSRSLADDYILVHGMAAGALTSDTVTEADYNVMVKLDHDALQALGSSVDNPRSSDAKHAAQAAIARLADYAEAVGTGRR